MSDDNDLWLFFFYLFCTIRNRAFTDRKKGHNKQRIGRYSEIPTVENRSYWTWSLFTFPGHNWLWLMKSHMCMGPIWTGDVPSPCHMGPTYTCQGTSREFWPNRCKINQQFFRSVTPTKVLTVCWSLAYLVKYCDHLTDRSSGRYDIITTALSVVTVTDRSYKNDIFASQ